MTMTRADIARWAETWQWVDRGQLREVEVHPDPRVYAEEMVRQGCAERCQPMCGDCRAANAWLALDGLRDLEVVAR
jgi:hypothetical protein